MKPKRTLLLLSLFLLVGAVTEGSWLQHRRAEFRGGAGGTIGPISIAAGADDGYITGTSFGNGDADVEAGRFGSNKRWGFWRFILPSAIPSGATIDSATLDWISTGTFSWNSGGDGGPDDLIIQATDAADAALPAAAGDRPTASGGSTTLTSAQITWTDVPWPSTGSSITSPTIASVIQELVTDNGGLASGADIVIWMAQVDTAVTSEGDVVKAAAENHSTYAPATLSITYH